MHTTRRQQRLRDVVVPQRKKTVGWFGLFIVLSSLGRDLLRPACPPRGLALTSVTSVTRGVSRDVHAGDAGLAGDSMATLVTWDNPLHAPRSRSKADLEEIDPDHQAPLRKRLFRLFM